MKYICIDSCGADLTLNNEYEQIREKGNEHIYVLNDSGDIEWYSKLRFEPVKENTMKISKWEDLKEIKVRERTIDFRPGKIDILNKTGYAINIIQINEYTQQELIGILGAIGLDIEFVPEITITQNEFDFLNCFEYPEDKSINKAGDVPRITYLRKSDVHIAIKKDMFKFIKNGEKYLVSDLLKMKVSE